MLLIIIFQCFCTNIDGIGYFRYFMNLGVGVSLSPLQPKVFSQSFNVRAHMKAGKCEMFLIAQVRPYLKSSLCKDTSYAEQNRK